MSSKTKGLYKIGIRNAITVKEGFNYAKNLDYSQQTRPICLVGNKLFVRDLLDPAVPLKLYDKDTLNPIEDEDFKKNLLQHKRNIDVDNWNKPLLEITTEAQLKSTIKSGVPGTYRSLRETPLFTDGTNLYVISTHYIKAEIDSEEPNLDALEKTYSIEIYDPVSLELLQTLKLDLDAGEAGTSPDDVELLRNILSPKLLDEVVCATNGKTLILGKGQDAFVFSLETGKRYPERLSFTFKLGGYNNFDSRVWGLDSYQLRFNSNRVSEFGDINSLQKIVDLNQLKLKRDKEILSSLKQKTQMVPRRTTINLLKKLVKSENRHEKSQQVIKETQEVEKSLSAYAIASTLYQGCTSVEKTLKEYELLDKKNKGKFT